jgi:3',5'-cyclic AMP phosphodiesterase CpdA
MPVILGPRPTRRDFLRTTILSAGAALAGGCRRLSVGRGPSRKVARWALMADTHVTLDPKEVYRTFNIDDNFKKAVAQVVAASPDGAVIAGDIARLLGKPEDYRMVVKLIEPMISRMPVGLVLGNHDHLENFFKAFPRRTGQPAPVEKKHVAVVETAGLRLVLLDSLLETNMTGGQLGEGQLRWLETYLSGPDRRPAFVFFHHDVAGGKNSLLDAEAFFKIVLPRKQVKAVFYGHTHVYRYSKIEDLHLVNVPAVGYSFKDDQPLGWLDARMTAEGGDFTLRAFASNTADNGKTTSLAWRG